MRKLGLIILLAFSLSCDKECNESLGVIIQKEIEVAYFDEIIAHSGIEVILKHENTQKIIIETGENRMDNVHISVNDEILELEADDSCFLNPSYVSVKVFISSPNIKIIRNSSEHTISSDGVLSYPEIKLITENNQNGYNNIGNLDLKFNNNKVTIVSNGMSSIKISGTTNILGVYYYGGIGKFEGVDLIAQDVDVFHRGENNLKINPQNSITGDIYATGNVISSNHPPLVDVTEHFTGELIFE